MLRAISSFWVGQRLINGGDIVASTDPSVKGREALFEEVAVTSSVEQATAAPGEKRTTSRAKKS